MAGPCFCLHVCNRTVAFRSLETFLAYVSIIEYHSLSGVISLTQGHQWNFVPWLQSNLRFQACVSRRHGIDKDVAAYIRYNDGMRTRMPT